VTAARLIVALLTCSALLGCSVDDRRLETGSDGEGGVPSSAGAGHAGSSSGSHAGKGGISGSNESGAPSQADGGAGGASEPLPPLIATVGGCADLDEDGVADCQESLLTNPSFEADVAHWSADAGASLTWDPRDALGAANSGTALLSAASSAVDTGGSSLLTAGQCITVTGGQIVIAYANALVEDGQDTTGKAAIYVDFYDAAGCGGASGSSFSTPQPLDAVAGTWLTLKAASLTSAATHSARVMLALEKPLQAQSFHARFDNVLIKSQPAN
jgi:hypothetical protein